MNQIPFKLTKITAALTCSALLFACSNNSDSNTELGYDTSSNTKEEVSAIQGKVAAISYDEDDYYSEWKSENPTFIELNGKSVSYNGQGGVVILC